VKELSKFPPQFGEELVELVRRYTCLGRYIRQLFCFSTVLLMLPTPLNFAIHFLYISSLNPPLHIPPTF
jgi:hypothetical protein